LLGHEPNTACRAPFPPPVNGTLLAVPTKTLFTLTLSGDASRKVFLQFIEPKNKRDVNQTGFGLENLMNWQLYDLQRRNLMIKAKEGTGSFTA
jgi:hypothetical protein